MKKLTLAFSALALCFLVACGQNDNDTTFGKANTIDYKVEHQASLLRALPSNAVAYTRYPSLVSLITTPQADALYPAQSNKAMQSQTASIIEGLDKNLLSQIEDPAHRELLSLYIKKQAAPIEMAVLAASSVTPELLLQTKINISQMSEFTDLLKQIVAVSQGQLQLTSEPDAQGNFELATGPFKAYGYFDINNKDFVVYGGPTANENKLIKYRANDHETRSDLKEFEAQFDTAGAGFAFWADTDKLWTQLSVMAPPEIRQSLENFNLQNAKFVYMGTASKAGHSSLRAHIEYKNGDDNLFYFPASQPSMDAKVAAPVNYAATVPMLNQTHLAQIVKIDNQLSASPSLEATIEQASDNLKELYQFDLSQLMSAFGSSATIVSDKAGTWISLPIQNISAFDTLIEITQKKPGAVLRKSHASGIEITHYTFPGLTKLIMESSEDEFQDNSSALLKQLLSVENTHVYWIREGDNLIISSLPQTLIARERHKSELSISDWTKDRGISRDDSILSIAVNAEGLPKTAYHMYLTAIQSLSDVAGVEPNLTVMPLAEDLNLSEDGRIGVALNTGKNATSLVLDYEQTPLDYIAGGNAMTSVAIIGILAAVSIPAYQDYTVRARASEALVSASQLKLELAEYYLVNGALPAENDNERFLIETDTATIYYDATDIVIKIIYSGGVNNRLSGTELHLRPNLTEDGYISWTCSNESAPEALIPSSCRN